MDEIKNNQPVSKGGRRPGAGRKPGIPNRTTTALKDMILGALDKSGGIKYLTEQAEKNPAAFMTLIGKVLPLTLAGDKDSPVHIVTKEARDAAVAAATRADK